MGAQKVVRLAVTAGDPFGVGPEVILHAIAGVEAEITIYGDPRSFPGCAGVEAVPFAGEVPERRGPTAEGGKASLEALRRALVALREGRHDALVTAPISKEAWALGGGPVDGHTPYLGRFAGVEHPLMAFVFGEREPVVALQTVHIPLRAVAASLTSDRVERSVRTLGEALARRFRRSDRPRIGVLGLNPHAGEGGRLGTEEEDHIRPAVARLREEGWDVEGPLPGDTAFALRGRFDGLLAMYHDQGLAPVKALAFRTAVNVTLGLPFVRTSPAHGTAFELAGTGRADPESMRHAILWAVRLTV
jgi:4-hydroxythreonine-4-phosphate dehydrogenase